MSFKHPLHLISVFFAFLLWSFAATANSKPTIHWLIWDLPPEFIKSGPLAHQGYADKFLSFYIEHLPQYNHILQTVNVSRWSTEVLKPNRCSAHLWGGFFPGQLKQSKPYTFTPPHVLIAHKRLSDRLGPAGTPQSIEKLLKQGDLKLLIQKIIFNNDAKQSRYPVLFPYLSPYQGQSNLIEMTGGRNDLDFRLLALGRADLAIGYPTSITTQQRVFDLPDEFVSYPIIEHDLYKNVYVACNNDAFGQKIISKINDLLTEETYYRFLSYHEEWNAKNSPFRKTYIDYFIDAKSLTNVID